MWLTKWFVIVCKSLINLHLYNKFNHSNSCVCVTYSRERELYHFQKSHRMCYYFIIIALWKKKKLQNKIFYCIFLKNDDNLWQNSALYDTSRYISQAAYQINKCKSCVWWVSQENLFASLLLTVIQLILLGQWIKTRNFFLLLYCTLKIKIKKSQRLWDTQTNK